MTQVCAFRALRYDPARVAIDDCVAPPYDIISPDEAQRLRAKSPFNITHVDLPLASDGPDPYAAAAALFQSWRTAGVLRLDPEPSFYLITDTFELEGCSYRRTGVTAAVRLEPLGAGSIFPHESTLAGPRMDRFRLMATTSANLSSILAMFPDPAGDLRAAIKPVLDRPPLLAGLGPTGPFELRRIVEPALIARVSALFADRPLFIADGHHRYETALAYHRTAAGVFNDPASFVMMHLVAVSDPALKALPTHRLIRPGVAPALPELLQALARDFTLSELSSPVLPPADAPFGSFLLRADRRNWLLTLKPSIKPADIDPERSRDWSTLDVAILQKRVLEPILGITPDKLTSQDLVGYSHDLSESVRSVDSGLFALAFLLRPTPVSAVAAVAANLEKMPPKSTYFYPKLITGLILRPLNR